MFVSYQIVKLSSLRVCRIPKKKVIIKFYLTACFFSTWVLYLISVLGANFRDLPRVRVCLTNKVNCFCPLDSKALQEFDKACYEVTNEYGGVVTTESVPVMFGRLGLQTILHLLKITAQSLFLTYWQ